MTKLIKFTVVLIFLPFIAVSQTVIKGVVYNKTDNKPISGAIISILNEKNEAIAYDISSDKGDYNLSFNYPNKEIVLMSRMLGYKEEQIALENKSQQQNFFLEETGIEIKEVIVKSKPINVSEDTLKYSVNTFKSAGDRVIGDILKKLPGIEVTASGGIKYNGEPINKFYIEGLDLLENKYGIATNNVPVDAVQNVEVIENHQPIKSIKGMVTSAQAAINLKLKGNKMMRPVGGVRAGAGYSNEINWLLEFFALQASKKRQTIAMYKTNNTGNDITQEFNEQTLSVSDSRNTNNETSKNILPSSAIDNLPIQQERYLFNKTHTASLNNLWKLNEDKQLRINLDYVNDLRAQNSYIQSNYLLNDSTLIINENDINNQKQQMYEGKISYNDNSQGHYLDNELKLSIKTNKSSRNATINGSVINQDYNTPTAVLNNKLSYMKVTDNKIFNLDTYFSYTHQPENLIVKKNGVLSEQNIKLSNFYSKTKSYYSWGWGRSTLRINGNIEATVNNVKTDLTTTLFNDSLSFNKQISTLNFEISPLYRYKTRKLELELEIPVSNETLWQKDRQHSNKIKSENYLLYNARFNIKYKFNPFLNANISYRNNHSIGDYLEYLDAFMMKSYTNFYKSSGVMSLRKNQSLSLSFRYKNPLSSLFMNGFISYAPSETNKSVATRFIGLQSFGSDNNLAKKTEMWFEQFYLGKYISTIKTNFSLTLSDNKYKSTQIQQNIRYPFTVNSFILNFKTNTKISDAVTFIYSNDYTNSNTKINILGANSTSNLNQFSQRIKMYITPINKLDIGFNIEQLYNQVSADSYINLLFSNIDARLKLKKVDFELYWNNIFNKKEYSYSVFSGINSNSYTYVIRPQNLLFIVSFKF